MKLVLKMDWVQVWDDVLPEDYCKKIVTNQRKLLFDQPLHNDPEKNLTETGERVRTSMQSFITDGSDKLINEKTYELTQIPIENYENTSVIRYREGEEYKLHHDYFHQVDERYAAQMKNGGNRLSTAMFILDGNCTGGETYFPHLSNLKISPKTGRCVIWQNIFFTNVFGDIKINLNGESEHAGSLVKSGEKWIATKWIRAQKWQ